MGKFLKRFNTHSEYVEYILSNSVARPNISYCYNNRDVHYNTKSKNNKLTVIYNVETAGERVKMFKEVSNLTSVIINGNTLTEPEFNILTSETMYQFSMGGKNVVEYILEDASAVGSKTSEGYGPWFCDTPAIIDIEIPYGTNKICGSAFGNCQSLSSITIPNSVTIISAYNMQENPSLTSITIPNSVVYIGDESFNGCTNLTSVILEPTVPPTLGSDCFLGVSNDIKFYVPSESVDAYKAATNWSAFAEKILSK